MLHAIGDTRLLPGIADPDPVTQPNTVPCCYGLPYVCMTLPDSTEYVQHLLSHFLKQYPDRSFCNQSKSLFRL